MKASGSSLATITEAGFAVLDRAMLNPMSEKIYSSVPDEREEQVKNDLAAATLTKGKRPSVETSMHNVIDHPFVVHLHPRAVNGLMCAQDAEASLKRLFGDKTLYVEYTDPGYLLFKKVYDRIKAYRASYGEEPKVIWLQNHGIFVAGDTIDEIKGIYADILDQLEGAVTDPLPSEEKGSSYSVVETLPALRMMLSQNGLKTLRVRNNALIEYYNQADNQQDISRPFTPDAIVYCKSNYLFLQEEVPDKILSEAKKEIVAFTGKSDYQPKVLLIKGIGLVAVGDNAIQCDIILDVFEDAMKVAWLSRSFGGPHPMTREQIDFIDNWEVGGKSAAAGAAGRIRWSCQGSEPTSSPVPPSGAGIGRCLLPEGANIVVADLNEEAGRATAADFNRNTRSNQTLFVKTNVADIASLENLVRETVCAFGAIDGFISNAGVLRAGGLEEMTPENFDFVTRINYNAYFYATKVVSRVMKLQTKYAPEDYFADIIQINSKSGLQGSKANFAYAGGKFGGIGLTQSFALELAPFRIKVNAICPGNFYEGPLWSDPENGLFVQYLKAGKVPGAKTVEDVKAFYLSKVPMGKGCTPVDVTRGVLYLMEQCGETGQALPITGGQVMLN